MAHPQDVAPSLPANSALGLLPCPFCGSHAGFSFGNDGEVVNVRCSKWGDGCMGAGPNEYSRDKAREGWNHRAAGRASAEPEGALNEEERAELGRLRALVNSPETRNFLSGVRNEVAHQVERWGTVHDRAKEPADWFWLVGYLGGKALSAHVKGDAEKAMHHCISTSAALANWHAHIMHGAGLMQPGSSDLQQFLRETFGANFLEYQERKA